QRDAQDLLGLLLLDDETVEVSLHVARFAVEPEFIALRLGLRGLRRAGGFGLGKNAHVAAGEMLAHELLQLALELLRRRRPVEAWRLHNVNKSLTEQSSTRPGSQMPFMK